MGMIKETPLEAAEQGKDLDHSIKDQILIRVLDHHHHQAVHHLLDHHTGPLIVVQAPAQGRILMTIHTLNKTKLVEEAMVVIEGQIMMITMMRDLKLEEVKLLE